MLNRDVNSWDYLEFFRSPEFAKIVTFLKKEKQQGKHVIPEFQSVLRALALTPLEHVKVVILGQDPYPNPEHAHGLAFSVPDDVIDLPPTLKNIFKELVDDIGIPKPSHGNLEAWANEGVLLLNTVLTVEAGNRASHVGKGWEMLTNEIITTINDYREHIVFILWGKPASLQARFIDASKHFILTSTHPSPLSAHNGFFGSRPFSQTNNYLETHGISPIDWKID